MDGRRFEPRTSNLEPWTLNFEWGRQDGGLKIEGGGNLLHQDPVEPAGTVGLEGLAEIE